MALGDDLCGPTNSAFSISVPATDNKVLSQAATTRQKVELSWCKQLTHSSKCFSFIYLLFYWSITGIHWYISFICILVIQYLYALKNDHQSTILLAVFPRLYSTSPWLTYLIIGSLCLLMPLAHFFSPPHPPLSGNHHSVLCIYESSFCFVLLCALFLKFHI